MPRQDTGSRTHVPKRSTEFYLRGASSRRPPTGAKSSAPRQFSPPGAMPGQRQPRKPHLQWLGEKRAHPTTRPHREPRLEPVKGNPPLTEPGRQPGSAAAGPGTPPRRHPPQPNARSAPDAQATRTAETTRTTTARATPASRTPAPGRRQASRPPPWRAKPPPPRPRHPGTKAQPAPKPGPARQNPRPGRQRQPAESGQSQEPPHNKSDIIPIQVQGSLRTPGCQDFE
jgi:hypothetical protein